MVCSNDRKIFTVKQFVERNPAFSESSVRALINRASERGLEAAVLRLGRRVLIDEDLWFSALYRENHSLSAR